MSNSDLWAMDSACWLFAVEKKLLGAAEQDLFDFVTRRINGGLIGWTDRKKMYERCKLYIK